MYVLPCSRKDLIWKKCINKPATELKDRRWQKRTQVLTGSKASGRSPGHSQWQCPHLWGRGPITWLQGLLYLNTFLNLQFALFPQRYFLAQQWLLFYKCILHTYTYIIRQLTHSATFLCLPNGSKLRDLMAQLAIPWPFQCSAQQTHSRRAAPWHRWHFGADRLFPSQHPNIEEAGRAGQRSQKSSA